MPHATATDEMVRIRERAIEASASGITIADALAPDCPLLYVNAAFERMTGYHRDEVIGRNCRFLQGPEKDHVGVAEIRAAIAEQREGHALLRNFRKDGSPFWMDLTVSPLRDDSGRVTHFVGIQSDVTAFKRFEAEIEYRATHDSLTDLPNRKLLEDRVEQAFALSRRAPHTFGVLFIDLDRFKLYNDALGHAQGDRMLRTVADRLSAESRPGDTVARLGADEFALLCPELGSPDEIHGLIARVVAAIGQPIVHETGEYRLTASIGVAIAPRDGANAEAVLKSADLAMQRAKEQGRNNFQYFTPELHARAVERMRLERELKRALAGDEFRLVYQPQVSLDHGRIVGVEALIRWEHPTRGLLLPAEFIPVAEESGLIVGIGRWVLETAARQAAAWHASGQTIAVAVNLSALQVAVPSFIDDLAAVLRRCNLPPGALEMELTESAVAAGGAAFAETLREIRRAGATIAIDDFGTGYSSLSYLKQFQVDKVKIDQTFIRDIVSEPDDAAIVQAVIAMSHHLRLTVVAEGVETEQQAAFLRRCGCDRVQGWLFGPPVPPAEIGALLRESDRAPLIKAPEGVRGLLLVDDEENNLRALTRLLRRDGYQIHTATSAREGLDILAAQPVGVIVSDQRMPGMSGTEFLRRVKTLHPDTVRIVLSGYTDLSTVTAAINEGAIYRFLTKPWSDDALREDIRLAFQLYDSRQPAL